jgi:ribosomal protein S18 acetylase RimI-like enzyme
MWKRIICPAASSGSSGVYVAESDCQIVGFGSCGTQRTRALEAEGYEGEIDAIYVLKAFQRRAVGTRLLYAMASDLRGRGHAAASLWVLRDNAPARRFYERYGAQVVAEREDARPDGILVEAGYGWTDLERLVQLTRQSGART